MLLLAIRRRFRWGQETSEHSWASRNTQGAALTWASVCQVQWRCACRLGFIFGGGGMKESSKPQEMKSSLTWLLRVHTPPKHIWELSEHWPSLKTLHFWIQFWIACHKLFSTCYWTKCTIHSPLSSLTSCWGCALWSFCCDLDCLCQGQVCFLTPVGFFKIAWPPSSLDVSWCGFWHLTLSAPKSICKDNFSSLLVPCAHSSLPSSWQQKSGQYLSWDLTDVFWTSRDLAQDTCCHADLYLHIVLYSTAGWN